METLQNGRQSLVDKDGFRSVIRERLDRTFVDRNHYDLRQRRFFWDEDSQCQQMSRVFVPHLLIFAIFVCYLVFGAFCFRLVDQRMALLPFSDVVLFCFSTVATIGYGNICPAHTSSMIFTMFYSVFGIPLCMLTIANFGKYVTKCYWMLMICLGRKLPRRPFGEARLPFLAALFMFLLTLLATVLLFQDESNNRRITVENVYFSVISFSTVGFGDMYASTSGSIFRLIVLLCYLTTGIIVVSIWFTLVKEQVRKIYYFGRRYRGARDVQVWFGTKPMKVAQILEIVAREFNASPNQIHRVLNDLDFLISDAIAEHNLGIRHSPCKDMEER